MTSHGLTTALTLYRAGTLDLSTAAARAGLSADEFAAALRKRGIASDDPMGPGVADADGDRSARAD